MYRLTAIVQCGDHLSNDCHMEYTSSYTWSIAKYLYSYNCNLVIIIVADNVNYMCFQRQKTSKDPFPTSPMDTISPTSKQKRYELSKLKPSLYEDIPGSELGQQISPTSAVKGFSSDPLSPMFTTRTISAAPPVLSPTERLPRALPAVKANAQQQNKPPSPVAAIPMFGSDTGPQKKKYAKEAWPGKRPTPLLL